MPKNDKNSLRIVLDTKIYPLEAIYGACYVFIDRVYIFLESLAVNKIVVTFRLKPRSAGSKSGTSAKALEALSGEFMNELLNYVLRVGLSKENKKIRQYLVEQALFAAVGGAGESAAPSEKFSESGLSYSFEDDPLGIAVPWEEKYGQGTTTSSANKKIKNKVKNKIGKKGNK